MLAKRCALIATTLPARPLGEKAAIVAAVREHVWPIVTAGRVRPVIQGRYPLDRVADAHREMEASTHIGKILLTL
jgi:NADPH:quinone reductase-like Zn-dependent oxidoreductase